MNSFYGKMFCYSCYGKKDFLVKDFLHIKWDLSSMPENQDPGTWWDVRKNGKPEPRTQLGLIYPISNFKEFEKIEKVFLLCEYQ